MDFLVFDRIGNGENENNDHGDDQNGNGQVNDGFDDIIVQEAADNILQTLEFSMNQPHDAVCCVGRRGNVEKGEDRSRHDRFQQDANQKRLRILEPCFEQRAYIVHFASTRTDLHKQQCKNQKQINRDERFVQRSRKH